MTDHWSRGGPLTRSAPTCGRRSSGTSSVPDAVRMGARASIAVDQRPLGRAASEVITVDESGNEARELIWEEPGRGLVLEVVHFVDLDDGRRVTTEAFGEMSLHLPRGYTLDEVRDAVRE